jgi:hypothetical protein
VGADPEREEGRTVNVDGYEIPLEMYEQIGSIDLEAADLRHPHPSLVVQIDDRPKGIRPASQRLADRYANGRAAAAVEEPFWKEIKTFYGAAPNLYEETLRWMDPP